jgi:hypothetical protein
VVDESVSVEHNLVDAFFVCSFGDQLADLSRLFGLRQVVCVDVIRNGRRCNQGMPLIIVDNLGIRMLVRLEDSQSRPTRCARNLLSDPAFPPEPVIFSLAFASHSLPPKRFSRNIIY